MNTIELRLLLFAIRPTSSNGTVVEIMVVKKEREIRENHTKLMVRTVTKIIFSGTALRKKTIRVTFAEIIKAIRVLKQCRSDEKRWNFNNSFI